ncbi:hypothetical protein AQUCO_00300153v1 [Aquilegia coerulea]|uniref:ATP-dependent DNA helicase n=1 Tax=Aquilegia coerulea TaxID=218851 RepID=A0A2G5EXJ3_AQUCA|nr:hypothetical protein AQUCO_00300153v1 [Aquilegia coerulea]
MFDENNELIKVFRTARDRYTDSEVVNFRINLIGTRIRDARQYNLPSSNEIAGLLIGNDGDNVATATGKRLVLPATFTGGPRYMHQSFQDAMAICRWGGSPDLFLTVTCNPKWPEITEALNLIPGQKSEDRPDIVSRVFKIKLDLLMDDLCTHKHFGKVTADKPNTSLKINKIISAELPNKVLQPLAYESVLEFMIHGPHQGDKDNSPCMEKGKCSKHYPKQFSDDTVKDAEGFYTYRRRNNGRTGIKNGVVVDNTSVVPHNVDLIVKYQCHINVEACNQERTVKYLFKYIHKGKDRATVVIERNNEGTHNDGEERVTIIDEVKTYLDCRYISASEASWRIFGFSTQFRDPSVERLPFHLEDEQQVTFIDTDDTTEVLQRESTTKTKFLQWMEVNKANPENPDANDLTYAEFPTRWRWVEKDLEWIPRKKCKKIGRIYYAHPTSGERYYLRILLNHIKGAKNFRDLKTYNNITYNTFKEACLARGLLDDDGEWNEGLKFAATWSNAISDPLDLWKKNWQDLSDDILYRRRKLTNNPNLQMTIEEIQNAALCEIELLLNDNNLSLKNFRTMPIPDMSTHYHVPNRLIQEELEYDRSKLETEFSVLHESSSRIASLLLPGGRTAHSRFKIPLEVDDYSTCNISQRTDLAQLIRRADLVVWDEAPMNHRNIFEAVDKTFQDLMRKEVGDFEGQIFGGKTILLGGDFRQTLPVVPKGSREDVVAACISRSYLWSKCEAFTLKTNMRLNGNDLEPEMVKEIADFSEWILKLGEGKLPTVSINDYDEPNWIKIPEDLLIQNNGATIQQIIETIYPDISNRFTEPNYLKDRCILTPTNDSADKVNKEVLSRIHSISRIYASADTISPMSESANEEDFNYTMEYLNNLEMFIGTYKWISYTTQEPQQSHLLGFRSGVLQRNRYWS